MENISPELLREKARLSQKNIERREEIGEESEEERLYKYHARDVNYIKELSETIDQIDSIKKRAIDARSTRVKQEVEKFVLTLNEDMNSGDPANPWDREIQTDKLKSHLKKTENAIIRGEDTYSDWSDEELKELFSILFDEELDVEALKRDIESLKKEREKAKQPLEKIRERMGNASKKILQKITALYLPHLEGDKRSQRMYLIGIEPDFFEMLENPNSKTRKEQFSDFSDDEIRQLFFVLYGEKMVE